MAVTLAAGDRITWGDVPALEIDPSTDDLTISARVRPTINDGAERPILGKMDHVAPFPGWELNLVALQPRTYVIQDWGANKRLQGNGQSALALNQWGWVTAVYRASTQRVTHWIDGAAIASTYPTVGVMDGPGVQGAVVSVGDRNGSSLQFLGDIAVALVHLRALTDEEIQTLHASQGEDHLLGDARLHFVAQAGGALSAYDLGPNQITPTILGAPVPAAGDLKRPMS